MKKEVRFQIQDILPIALVLVVAGIGISYGLSILGDTRTDFLKANPLTATCNTTTNGGTGSVDTGCSYDYQASTDSIQGTAKLPEKMPLIVNIVVASIIIGILLRYMMVRQ